MDKAPRIVFGTGAVERIAQEVEEVRARYAAAGPVLVVFGASSRRQRWRASLLRDIAATAPVTFCEHGPGEVSEATIAALVDAGRGSDARILVAAGGGTVMDAVKVASVRLRPGAPIPVVAVPTTPGTGAEVTPFATVWDRGAGRKRSVAAPGLAPAVAVIDPDLTLTLPRTELVSCVLDALCQGVEAAWSTASTQAATAYGLSAVALVVAGCERVRLDTGDRRGRALLSLAATRSGQAIAIAHTTVCHALSYPLTLRYGVRHGHACGVVLGRVLAYNAAVTPADCRDLRGVERVRTVVRRIVAAMDADSVGAALRAVDALLAFGALPCLEQLSASSADVARDAMTYSRAANNPREVDVDRLFDVLR